MPVHAKMPTSNFLLPTTSKDAKFEEVGIKNANLATLVVLSSLQCSSLSHVGVQCCLHDSCCGSGVVLGTLPCFLPAGVLYLGRWLGLRPAAAGALLPGGPH